MKINNNVFLTRIIDKIKLGDYDQYLTLPFMTRELLLTSLKAKFERRLETGGTPILSDDEIQDCILQAKETAAMTCSIFAKFGFVERTEDGFKLTDKGELALRIRK